MVEKRFGGVPPIVTVLITMSALVAASLVAWFMWITTSSATKQPVLEVTDAYTDGTNVYFTLRNIGSADATVNGIQVSCKGSPPTTPSCTYPTGSTIPKGSSAACRASGFSALTDGDFCVVQITLSSPTTSVVNVEFKVMKP
jgi:hypothetical protein